MEDTPEETTLSGMNRRDFVKRSAILGGMVWAAPAMTTLGSRAFGVGHVGSPDITEDPDCSKFIAFKWDRDDGFVACDVPDEVSAPYPCLPDEYKALANAEVCVTLTDDQDVAVFNGFSITATYNYDTKQVTLVASGNTTEIRALGVWGGNACNPVEYENGNASNSITIGMQDVNNADVSHITGVICYVPSA